MDDKGGLLIPIELKVMDSDFVKYCHFDVDWGIKPITKEDLPIEFSDKAVKLVDMFRRKTINLDFECLMFFDYVTGELIYCFVKENEKEFVEDVVDINQFKGKHIASIHNHPYGALSAPSGENFQIFNLEFEDYELISGFDEFWIICAKGIIKDSEEIQLKIFNFYQNYLKGNVSDEVYSNFLINYLNNNLNNIKINKKEF